jgi:hypothetical protein
MVMSNSALSSKRPAVVPQPQSPLSPFGGTIGVIALAFGVGVLAAFAFDWHSHQCACGNKWSHLGAFAMGSVDAHRCSRCGTVQFWKAGAYDTDGAFQPAEPVKPRYATGAIALNEPRW